ncbi:hypothetical protein IscW_ISCW009173, partial [Ixodes scapularis]
RSSRRRRFGGKNGSSESGMASALPARLLLRLPTYSQLRASQKKKRNTEEKKEARHGVPILSAAPPVAPPVKRDGPWPYVTDMAPLNRIYVLLLLRVFFWFFSTRRSEATAPPLPWRTRRGPRLKRKPRNK